MKKLKFNLSGFEFSPGYFTKLLGFVHRIIGENNIHDEISLYSFSHIHNKSFTFAAWDEHIYNSILRNFKPGMILFDNCKLLSIEMMRVKTDKDVFKCASPFFVKYDNMHLIFKDAEAAAKNTLIKKAHLAGIDPGEFELEFVDFKKTSLIKIHNIDNRCFVSGVRISGDDNMKKLACKVGIGNSTGVGFGFIY